MLGPFFASRVKDFLPSKVRGTLDMEEVRDSYERLFDVMSTLMGRGYPNVEMGLAADEARLVVRSFG